MRAKPLTAAEGSQVMVHYAERHRIAARKLCRLMGYQIDGSESDYRAVGERIPFLRLIPQATPA